MLTQETVSPPAGVQRAGGLLGQRHVQSEH